MRTDGVRLFHSSNPVAAAGIFICFRWILLAVAARILLSMTEEVSAVMVFNAFLIMLTATTVGLYIRSSTLFLISIPIQLISSGAFLSHCFAELYIINQRWTYNLLSLTHLLIILLICFYDLYVTITCIDKFRDESEELQGNEPRKVHRRSPGAAIVNVFYGRLESSPYGQIETPRACDDEDSCIEAALFDHKPGRLV